MMAAVDSKINLVFKYLDTGKNDEFVTQKTSTVLYLVSMCGLVRFGNRQGQGQRAEGQTEQGLEQEYYICAGRYLSDD